MLPEQYIITNVDFLVYYWTATNSLFFSNDIVNFSKKKMTFGKKGILCSETTHVKQKKTWCTCINL